jgi:16S rRNA (cytidine1402-2'-O)-methyltransferase
VLDFVDELEALGLTGRAMCAGREMTKQFETFYRGAGAEVFAQVRSDPNATRGEWVWVLAGQAEVVQVAHDDSPISASVRTWLGLLLPYMPLKTAVSVVVEASGLPKKGVYNQALLLKQTLGDLEQDERLGD